MSEELNKWPITEEAYKSVALDILKRLDFNCALIYELDDRGKLHARYGKRADLRASVYHGGRIPESGGVFDLAIKEGKEQIVDNPQIDTRCTIAERNEHETRPFAVIPFQKNGKAVLTVSVSNCESGGKIEHPKVIILRLLTNLFFEFPETTKSKSKIFDFFLNEVLGYLCGLIELKADMQAEAAKDRAYQKILYLTNEIVKTGNILESQLNDKMCVKKIKKYFREALRPWFAESILMTRALLKPRGYPGDYQLLEMIYDNKPASGGLGYFLDRYFLDDPLATAVRNRKDVMRELLKRIIEEGANSPLHILNLASGSSRDIKELAPLLSGSLIPEFTCVDFDEESIMFSRQALKPFAKLLKIDFVKEDILKLIDDTSNYKFLSDYDVIYSIGLADYLPDRILKKTIKWGFGRLGEGGKLIVAHKDCSKYEPLPEDWLCDWHFYPRTEKYFIDMISGIGLKEYKVDVVSDNSIIYFVTITKKQ